MSVTGYSRKATCVDSASLLTQSCLVLMTDQVANEKGQDALLSQAGKEPQDCEAMVSPQDCGPPSLPTARSQAWMPT